MSVKSTGSKAVAIASSTGGPKALQSLIPFLPAELDAPVFIVQHMPAGFTEALSIRLDQLSGLSVKEAAEGKDMLILPEAEDIWRSEKKQEKKRSITWTNRQEKG